MKAKWSLALMLVLLGMVSLLAGCGCGDDDDDDCQCEDDDTADDDSADDDTVDDDMVDDDVADDDLIDDDVTVLFDDQFDGTDYTGNWSVAFSTGTYNVLETNGLLGMTSDLASQGNVWLVTNELFDESSVKLECAFRQAGYGRSGIGFWIDAGNWLTLTVGTDVWAGYRMGGAWNSLEAYLDDLINPGFTYPDANFHTAAIVKSNYTYTFMVDGAVIGDAAYTSTTDWLIDAFKITLYTRTDTGASGNAAVGFQYCTLTSLVK